jgi:hypothetical protein
MFVAERSISFTETEARAAIANSVSWAETLRRLGLRDAGGNHLTLKKYAALWQISTDHFDPYASSRGARPNRIPLSEVLVENSTYHRGHLKDRLFFEGIKDRRCEMCGQGEVWRGRVMSLILDHINGIANDHRLENLRVLCPNCAATLDTHCGRKNRRPPIERVCQWCERVFVVKYPSHRYCSSRCGHHAPPPPGPKPETRKVERPPYEQLLREIAETNYSAVGRKYGVSDNAIRKWVRWYERERERQRDEALESVALRSGSS